MRISAPIFRSLSLMVPQVASAKTVLARPMRRTNLGGIGFRARAFGAGSNNGGMGTFYRSKHELVFVWKSGTAPHLNNFELGQHGRNRTNVWDYAGINTFRSSRMDELQMHPTVKPVALVVDAIKDCSKQGDIVLDPFCGSGTIIVAAERTGRKARALEIDPVYIDVAIRRWEQLTGKSATLSTGGTFEEITEQRTVELDLAQVEAVASQTGGNHVGVL
jgi:DNA methylase